MGVGSSRSSRPTKDVPGTYDEQLQKRIRGLGCFLADFLADIRLLAKSAEKSQLATSQTRRVKNFYCLIDFPAADYI